jgi:ADP-ribose pyrophosphatase YjhB (NUDIX family)
MNKEIKSFNLRVYALIIDEEYILVSRELIMGKYLYKFPGGGLEYGEGLIEGLQRESMEEMNQNLKDIEHFYTTDFYQQSQFDSKDQLIAIYYKAKLTSKINNKLKVPIKDLPVFEWKKIIDFSEEDLHFPTDKFVFNLLKNHNID